MNTTRRLLFGDAATLRTAICKLQPKPAPQVSYRIEFPRQIHITNKKSLWRPGARRGQTRPPSHVRFLHTSADKASPSKSNAPWIVAGVLSLGFATYWQSHSLRADAYHSPLFGQEHDVGSRPVSRVDSEKAHTSQSQSYRLAYIKKDHGPDSERPWVIRGTKVYDITDWVAGHPGGEVILKAAGGPVEPYWALFKVHDKQYVHDILEEYYIGIVDENDLVDGKVPAENIEDPFSHDPARDSRLRVITPQPCNAETPGEHLSDFTTPTELLYVRNHFWVPTVKAADHRLTIELSDGSERIYTMQELRDRFQKHSITSVMQCSGNRRNNMTRAVKATNGLQWTVGGIGNATWAGVRLRDVLRDAGYSISDPSPADKHVQFTGMEAYGGSIPIDKALDAHGDVLLAYEMNGRDLTPDHGYPLRVVVPGHVAARSVKWLNKIVISDEESPSQWQRRDYKCFGPNEAGREDWEKAKSIQEMPVTSAITAVRSKGAGSPSIVEGYAYSGGGREVVRLDISADGGKTWDQAQFLPSEKPMGSKAWAWKRWTYEVPKGKETKDYEVVVKATDDAYNTQPEHYDCIFNARGNLATAWHRVRVKDGKVEGSL